jgi:hypothetical protein
VVNDLIVKKRFRLDFKKIVLDEKLSNEEKINEMNDEYKDIFEEMEEKLLLLTPLSTNILKKGNIDELKKLVDL